MVKNGNGNGNWNGAEATIASATTTPSFLSEFTANIKWVGIGAGIGFVACWFLKRRR